MNIISTFSENPSVNIKKICFNDFMCRNLTSGLFSVPQVLRICTQFIEEFGVINGIYRASGISSNIQRIK